MSKLEIVTDAKAWDAFIGAQNWSQFTQSWAWGEFRVSRGQAIERLALVDADGKWSAASLCMHFSKPLVGGYWYAPRGPVVQDQASDTVALFMDALVLRGLPKRALFWRFEPTLASTATLPKWLVRSHAFMPASTLLVDLTQSEDELMKAMHEKTRYNIRVAERHGVTVRLASTPADVDAFLKLNEETASRDEFTSMPTAHIRATYEFLHARGMCEIRLAEREGKLLAASLEILFGDTVTYLYGASSSEDRNAMAPYALHWSALRDAKASGHRYYDFHGVNPVDEKSPYWKEAWKGITRFKLGWGGERRDLVGTWELPRMPFLYTLFHKLTRS